jgi:hypothetical protein
MPIPKILPVGISRVWLKSGASPKKPRREFFNANIAILGHPRAKHFSVDKYGEEAAYHLAQAWRHEQMSCLHELLAKAGKKPHAKIGVPGKRKTAR